MTNRYFKGQLGKPGGNFLGACAELLVGPVHNRFADIRNLADGFHRGVGVVRAKGPSVFVYDPSHRFYARRVAGFKSPVLQLLFTPPHYVEYLGFHLHPR